MSCTLRAIGTAFDVDSFLAGSELQGAAAFRRDEPRLPGTGGPLRAASGFNLRLSEAGPDDLATQVSDAALFLSEHEDELRRLGSFPGVQEVCLDFAILWRGDASQSDIFPADLLWRAGALDIDLVVTHYEAAGGRTAM